MIDPTERVAIVGIGGIFPGGPDPEQFWRTLARGADATSAVPPGRWRVAPDDCFDPAVAAADRVYATRGGFVRDFAFDPEGLDLAPERLEGLDPMFHLALHAGRAAWRDAKTSAVDRARVPVIFGNLILPTETTSALARETLGQAFASRVRERLALAPDPPDESRTDPQNQHAAGLPAGLLARALGLGGGACTLDAACASSLYALKLAADELLSGRADAALTGGLSRPDPQYTQMGFSQLRALSPDGRAYPFDARGGGLVVGEGAGMFVLKRLSDAIRHDDHVYGIVAAVGLSNDVDGGLLAPSSEGQLRAMRSAYARAGWDPRDVDLIECHATGTPVGDAVEFQSLRDLWGDSGWSAGQCVIGSHKANIGHCLTASGAAGLMKVLLSLKHGVLPPTANFAKPGPKVPLENSPFRILSASEPWLRRPDSPPRRAAVSGFGFGGINAHALIEEYVPDSPASSSALPAIDPEREAEPAPLAIVGLSAYVGPFRGLRAFQERALGGGPAFEPRSPANTWGVPIPSGALGYHCDSLELPVDRFRIPPKELEAMLPQQSLMLLAAADALEDAHATPDAPRLRSGVFIGLGLDPNTTNFHVRWDLCNQARSWNEQASLGLSTDDLARWTLALRDAIGPPLTANRTMGALGGLVASRIAREFRVGGPSFTVSSEETSGLRALEIAARLLRAHEIDEAIVGAVDLTGDPRILECAARAGTEKLVRADAAAALVLKRLDDAERDGDRIHAVVRGIGATSGFLLDPPGSAEALARALEDDSSTVQTPAVRIETLSARVRAESSGPPTALPRFGHAGAAHGLLAVVRAALQIHQRVLLQDENGSHFWWVDRDQGPRSASVEGSGVDGVSVAVLLEEPGPQDSPRSIVERRDPLGVPTPALFAIEARTIPELVDALSDLERFVLDRPGRPVETIARSWWADRPGDASKPLGLAIVAGESAELIDRVRLARRRMEEGAGLQATPGVHFRAQPAGRAGKIAFVYPGIGNHFPGMGREISARWPEILRAMERETSRLKSQLDRISAPEYPTPFPDQRAPIMGQVVLGTIVTDLLGAFGVRPDAVLGYSLGESTALFATRTWTERDAMHARLDESPLFRTELAGPCDAARRAWGLRPDQPVDWLAGIVPASPDAVRAALATIPRAYLLIINTNNEVVVGGRKRAVETLVKALGAPFLPLPMVSTVHCAIAREVEDDYRALHSLKTTPPPGLTVYSAGWGRAYTPDRETAADAIVAQALHTVDFPAVVRRAHDDGVRTFLEVGPGGSCTRLIRTILADRPHIACAACVPGEPPVTTLMDLLGQLIAERIPVDLSMLYGRETQAAGANRVDPQTPPNRSLRVPIGGPPFAPPAPSVLEADLPVTQSHAPARPHVNGNAAHARTPGPIPALATRTPDDPLARQVLATELSRGRAHEAFLRSADAMAESMSGHLAFQMALIESLTAAPAARAPIRESPAPALDRAQCLEFAIGSIANVLGADFAQIDTHPTRVRLPAEPLMLVDRILSIKAEPRALTKGRVVTEHDVLPDAWYLDAGKIPTCIAVESGQADLFLSGFLGIDFETKGHAVYRLLDATVVFHRGLPGPGEVILYDIHIDKFFRQGDTHLFRFRFEATVAGVSLMSMRDGCAGFFTAAALAAGKGIVHTAFDLRPIPGKRPDDWSPLLPMNVESYDDRQVDALRAGDLASAFGERFANLGLRDPIRLPAGRMTLVHRVPKLDPSGGRHGLGLIQGELDIHPDDWFLTCHFVDDQVMPGTLMYECCLHTLRIFLMRMGWVGESSGVAFEPVPGVASRLECRGQVTAETKSAVFEIAIKEFGYGPEPYAIADALMYADGRPVVEVIDLSIRLTGLTREAIESTWAARAANPGENPPLYDRDRILAFALGKPSVAFGARYVPFDAERIIARLPAPPYSFLDRIVDVKGAPWVMEAGAEAAGDYDVPPDAWYFAANRSTPPSMPFAVLLEIPLQVCGWLSAYVGSALTDEHDLSYRNLGGDGTLFVAVTPDTGTLTSRVKMTKVSRSGGMIIQHFDMETWAGSTLIYRGRTYFGFFRKEALANQVGIREVTPFQPSTEEQSRGRAFPFPRTAPLPDERLRMVDQVDLFVPDGGPHGLGFIRGTFPVDPSAWFFKAHFYQDPVCPGSLGLESFLQLLKVVAMDRWGQDADASTVGFEPILLGSPHKWVYRGQVLPTDALVTVQAAITRIDDRARALIAEGFLSIDGRVIYQMQDFGVRMTP